MNEEQMRILYTLEADIKNQTQLLQAIKESIVSIEKRVDVLESFKDRALATVSAITFFITGVWQMFTTLVVRHQ